MPDENDIVYNNYGPDLEAVGRWLFETLTGNRTTAEANGSVSLWDSIQLWLLQLWEIYSIIAFIISAILILGIIYVYIRLNQIAEIEYKVVKDTEKLWHEMYGEKRHADSPWMKIKNNLNSNNPNDWKLAIIEADILLDNTLIEQGYAGTSLGERLKSIAPSQLATLRDAWDAHMVRNKIAHQGADFVVTQKIARDTIGQYEKVLVELGVV